MNTSDNERNDKSPTTSTDDSRRESLQEWGDRFVKKAADAANAFLERKAPEDARREEGRKREALEAYGGRNRFYPPVAQARGIILLNRNPIQSPDGPTEAQLEAMQNIAGYHVEAGTREFGAWSRRMIENVDESVIPYLQSLYQHAIKAVDLHYTLENERNTGG